MSVGSRRAALKQLVHDTKSRPCMDCNGKFPVAAMQFDHRDPDQKVGFIGQFVARVDEEGLKAEIAKCDVVCANCHHVRTKMRGLTARQRSKSGTSSERAREVQNRPEVRAKKSVSQSAAMRELFDGPRGDEMRAMYSEVQREANRDSQLRAKRSRAARELWSDPAHRESHAASIRDMWANKVQSPEFNSDEQRAIRRERAMKAWETRRSRHTPA